MAVSKGEQLARQLMTEIIMSDHLRGHENPVFEKIMNELLDLDDDHIAEAMMWLMAWTYLLLGRVPAVQSGSMTKKEYWQKVSLDYERLFGQ